MRHPLTTGNLFGAIVAAALIGGTASPAHAYIDPGTGSMLLQVIGATIAGSMFYFRELRMKLLALVMRRDPHAPREDSASSPDETAH